jgi:hypothetical protein
MMRISQRVTGAAVMRSSPVSRVAPVISASVRGAGRELGDDPYPIYRHVAAGDGKTGDGYAAVFGVMQDAVRFRLRETLTVFLPLTV